jgi:hypothetical protein
VDWGPRPFRFNNHWLLHKDFKAVVEVFWRGCSVTGWMAYVLKENLKGLKMCIKDWNSVTYGSMDTKITKLILDISNLDRRSEQAGLSDEEVGLRKEMFSQLWHLKINTLSLLAQRSRVRWLREGDANSRYFHTCIKSRGKKNFIRALRVGNDWLETPVKIRNATVVYFRQQVASLFWNRPKLDGIVFPNLSPDDNTWLTRPFGMEEIERVVLESDGNKSPGPDGFNFAFLKAMWGVVKGEIRILMDQFHGIGTLPKSFNSYFVALIPKINSRLL